MAFRVVLSFNHPGEVVIELQADFTDPSYEQAILYADLYDDVRIQVRALFTNIKRSSHNVIK